MLVISGLKPCQELSPSIAGNHFPEIGCSLGIDTKKHLFIANVSVRYTDLKQ
jgi:hypothetical protein